MFCDFQVFEHDFPESIKLFNATQYELHFQLKQSRVQYLLKCNLRSESRQIHYVIEKNFGNIEPRTTIFSEILEWYYLIY